MYTYKELSRKKENKNGINIKYNLFFTLNINFIYNFIEVKSLN